MTSSRSPNADRQALVDHSPYDPSSPARASCSEAQLRERVLYLRSLAPTAFQELAFFAFVREDFKEAQCVLAAGADPEMTSNSVKSTPLMLAAQNGLIDIIELLRPFASPNTVDIDGETALFYAVHNNRIASIEALIGAVNPDLPSNNGDTPLMRALRYEVDPDIISALAQVCDMSATNTEGETSDQQELRLSGEGSRVVRDIFAQRRALIERDLLERSSSASTKSSRSSSPRV